MCAAPVVDNIHPKPPVLDIAQQDLDADHLRPDIEEIEPKEESSSI